MTDRIPYTEIMERMKSDIDYVAEEAYQKGLADGKKIERENIFKSLEKVSDGTANYDDWTMEDFRIAMELIKRLQHKR